jgi:hypothetical protein
MDCVLIPPLEKLADAFFVGRVLEVVNNAQVKLLEIETCVGNSVKCVVAA